MKFCINPFSRASLLACALFGLSGLGAAMAEEDGMAAISETSVAVDVIVDIDRETRTITLKAEGDDETWDFVAGPEVQNFDQLERGDLVILEYYAGLAVALGPKGSGLEARVTETDVDRAKEGEKPGVTVTETTYVQGQVADVNVDLGTVTLEGPENSLTFVAGENIDLDALDVGQQVEVLYIESYAISVEDAPKVSGSVDLKMKSIAIGVGVEWGSGTLTMYDDTTHELKISGLTLVDVGASAVEATGEIYHLVEARDIEGNFISGEAGAVLVEGGSVMALKNENGVVLKLKSSQKGARLTLAAQGLKIELK